MLLLSSKHGGFERRVRFFPVFHLLMPLLSSHGFLVAPSSFHFVTRHNKQQHHNRGGGSHHDHDASSLNSALFSSGSRRSSALSLAASPYLSAETVYFDIQVAGQDVGRLIFDLTIPSPLPLHAENLIALARGDRRSVDPAAHYVKCEFDFGTDYVEDGRGRYRWSHVLRGRGRNAVGRADELISDPPNQLQCTHSVYGGQYYGDKYEEDSSSDGGEDPGVLLTVQVAGPGRGSSRFSVVRVGESPPEWRERLLLNSGVIGRLRPECIETVHLMARQRSGPPMISAAGVLETGKADD